MKTTRIFMLRNSLFVVAILLAFSNFTANAQTANTPSANVQPASTPVKPVARITQAVDETKLVPLRAVVHPLARAEFDRGVVPDSQPMNHMMFVLQRSPEQQAALSELMNEQQIKSSPYYHAWLTPATFGQQFGVADADVQSITNWLAQKGFTGIKVAPSNMFIEFSGTAGKVRTAFHTEIHNFMVKGEMHMANVSVPQMPAAFAPVVQSLHSLHNFRKHSDLHFVKPATLAKAQATMKPGFTATPCPSGFGLATCYGMAPGDFAKIYSLPAGLDGTGQTIALVARSNVVVSDITQFGTAFGISNLTNFTAANNVILTGPDPGLMPGDQDEATLDVEWSGAVAPKAKILLVPSDIQASTFVDGVDLSSLYIVQNNLAQILSQSFGVCEAESDGLDNVLWEQAAAQGITVTVSTGDTGSASCDPDQFSGNFTDASDAGLAVSGDASTQFNVAVGGTDFDDAANPSTYWNATNSGTGLASAKGYIPELTWNGGCASAATAATLNSVCSGIDLNPQPPDPPSPDLASGGGGQSNCSNNTVNADGSVTCATAPNGGTPKPIWQQTAGLTGMPADSVRDIPDVSLFAAVNTASNNFYIICEASSALQNGAPCNLTGLPMVNGQLNYSFSGVGGTSASTPAFAGIIALVNQNEVNAGRLKPTEGQGNVNYVLYSLAVQQFGNATLATGCNSSLGTGINTGCTFNDITKGNNSVPCVGSFTTGFPNVFDSFTTPNCSTTAAATGVLVEPSTPNPPFSATTPGFTTTAGYDLATGLGSVNVTNLVANWPNVTTAYKSSTSTITSTVPSNLTTPAVAHGASVTFNVAVTSASGTPTGDVTLIPGEGFAGTGDTVGATLTAGAVQIITNELPGGTYPVTVHYAGDGTFAPSDSAPVMVTVSKEASTSQLAMWEYWNFPSSTILSPASAPYGSQYLFRVDVLGSNAPDNQACTTALANQVIIPCPTGKVTFTADGNPLNDFLNNGGAPTNSAILNPFGFIEDRVLGSTGLPVGAHTIAATYAGDNSYNGSTANTLAITITTTPTQTAVGAAVNNQAVTTVAVGQSVTLIAAVGTFNPATDFPSAGAGPTGSITFSTCGTATSCKVTVVPVAGTNTNGGATASASLATTFTTAGTQTITATYTGDTNYNACTTANTTPPADCVLTPLVLAVTDTPTQLAFKVQPSSVGVGNSISPAVTVAVEDAQGNVVANATNAVTIAIGTNPGSGTLGGTLTENAVAGIATFANLTISKAGTGYTLTASGMQGATALTGATSATFNVISGGTFTVTYPAQPTILNSTTGAAAGTTVTVTPSGGFTGPVVLTAMNLPEGVTCPSSPLTITVTGAGAVTNTFNCQVAASSTVLMASNVSPSPMYQAKATPQPPVNSSGKGWWALSAGTGFAALFLIFLPGGRKRLHAALGLALVCLLTLTLGCNGVNSGGGGTPVATTTAMTVNADKEMSGTAFTFNVTVTGGTPTGQVELFDNGAMIGTAVTVANGTAMLSSPTTLAVGTHSISVHYLGDAKTMPSQSGSLNLTVQGATTVGISTNPAAVPAAAPINFTVQ